MAVPCSNVVGDSSATDLGRFGLRNTHKIHTMLERVMQSPDTATEVKELCGKYLDQSSVPWKLVQVACTSLRQQNKQGATMCLETTSIDQQSSLSALPAICAGSSIVLPSPPARQRSQQLQQRLDKLQEQLDTQRYAAMVSDVTKDEQQAAAAMADPFFPTTKLQLSFGLHVLVTMGTFFALGYYGGKFWFRNESWAALSGALGLVGGLLLETSLLILRMNMPAPLDKKYAHLLDKSWEHQGHKAMPEAEGQIKGPPSASQLPASMPAKPTQLRRRAANKA